MESTQLLSLFILQNLTMTHPSPWIDVLSKLPVKSRLPSFYLAHGSPGLLWPDGVESGFPIDAIGGPKGPHKQFLAYFGKWLLSTYKPKALVVFSAHWESKSQIQVMKYEKNHLYYDYYGFPDSMYKITWESKGSAEVADRVVELLQKNKIPATSITSGRGLDHGVFIPFKIMFPDPFEIPLVEVSLNTNLDPQTHIDIGKALSPLRDEGVLIIAGGLSIHSFREMHAWDPNLAPQGFKDFEKAVVDGVETTKTGEERNTALKAVTTHPFYRRAHPREEHFIPIYVAAGAGTEGDASAVCKLHGALTIAFGL